MSPSDESTNGSRCSSCISSDNDGNDFGKSDEFTCKQCKNSDSKSKSKSVNDSDKLRRIIVASVKGFTIGTGLKGGLAIFSIVARFARRRRSSPQSRKTGEFSNSEAIAMGIKETLRYGLFLGTFAGTFVSVDEAIAALAGDKRHNCKMEGPVCWIGGWTIYASHRAKYATYEFGCLYIDACCGSRIALRSAYILKQESLPSSYKSFLNKQGGKDLSILQGVKDIATAQPFTNLRAIEKYYKSVGVDIKLDPTMKVPCTIIHGNESCVKHGVTFFLQAYKRALPVYVPVYLIPALIVHRQDLLKKQYSILGKGLLGTARSSLFLATYCSSAWAWTCLLFRTFETCNIPLVAIATFPTGLALAIEKKSRRIEISLYCLARAIESFFTCMTEAGYIRPPKSLRRADVVVFSVSTAIIMHCYAQERDVFRSKYLNVLDWVFGVPPPPPAPSCETT
ncbi:F21H2.12 [Arabidopsis thaliana]|uniref:F21H2.12 n=1 Tax=Arabidopsis thaliana TaxID=3702 RepID=Q9S9Y9_ARATH|nr:F21H2.12 [Arabidopsis thaliana]